MGKCVCIPKAAPASAYRSRARAALAAPSLRVPIAGLGVLVRLVDVLLIDPGGPALDLLQVNVNAVEHNSRQCPSVSVQAVSVQLNLPAEHQLAQMLLGPLTERLGFFSRIDPTEADRRSSLPPTSAFTLQCRRR